MTTGDYDLVVRGGTIVDGTGGAPFIADVAIRGGLIAPIGAIAGSGAEEIDAAGRIVTPASSMSTSIMTARSPGRTGSSPHPITASRRS